MALYHFTLKRIQRSKGESACAAAAYCSADKICCEYDGRTHDYRKKQNVEYSVVMLPDNAPANFADRSVLWNAVEQTEKQANAQLAREIEFALPVELDEDARRKLALEFVQEIFVKDGMCADVNFHNKPELDSRKRPVDADGNVTEDPNKYVYKNPHVHVLLPMRPLDENGNWETKKQKLYVCEKDGVQKIFTSAELKNTDGWEKLYNYKSSDGNKSWHTKSYAGKHPDECAELVNRYPKCEQKLNPKVERWNNPETLVEWRAAWSEKVNQALAEHNIEERVDHRSYAEQGLELIPTVHEGKAVTIEEKRLKEEYERKIAAGEQAVRQHTDIRNLNNAIRMHNDEIRITAELKKMKDQMQELLQPVKLRVEQFGQSVAEKLETLRINIINITVKIRKSVDILAATKDRLDANRQYIKALKPVSSSKLKELGVELQATEKKLHSVNKLLQRSKYDELQQKYASLQSQIELYKDNLQLANNATREINKLSKQADKLNESIVQDNTQKLNLIQEYQDTLNTIPIDEQLVIDERRLDVRHQLESKQDKSGDYFIVAESVDEQLGIANSIENSVSDSDIGIHL